MAELKQSPIVSICIPTYNRARCLENLFQNLLSIKDFYGDEIEICVSSNQSSDATPAIIKIWREKLDLKVVTQPRNIGATRNGIEVMRMASGKWILIIGDDDTLIQKNFGKLWTLLQSSDGGDWLLVGVADDLGKEHLLGNLAPGRYSARSFKRVVLQTGIHRYGFFGMHLFPSTLRPEFLNVSFEGVQSWPHLALFLRHLQGGYIRVCSFPLVQQLAGGVELFWNQGDWVRVSLRKLNIIAEVRKASSHHRWFFSCLLLRELYFPAHLKNLVLWKVLEPKDFHDNVFREVMSRYLLMGPFAVFAPPHLVFLLSLWIVPSRWWRELVRLTGREKVVLHYIANKKAVGQFDARQRGL